MEGGQSGHHGAIVNQIVNSKGTEPVTLQLLCLVELIVLATQLSLALVMGVTAVLVKHYKWVSVKKKFLKFYPFQTHQTISGVLRQDSFLIQRI